MKRGTACAVHVHFSAVPQETHHVYPQEYGGKTVKTNLALICSNAHGDVHYFIDLLLKYHGKVPYAIARTFGRRVRDLARVGYAQIVEHHPEERLAFIREAAVRRLEAA